MEDLTRRQFISPDGLKKAASYLFRPLAGTPLGMAVEAGCEIASGVILVNTALQGSRDKLNAYGVASEATMNNAPGFAEEQKRIESLANNSNRMFTLIDKLYRQWEDAYYVTKTRPVTKIDCDSKGNCTTTVEIETYQEWEEPSELTRTGLKENVIFSWREKMSNVQRGSNQALAEGGPAFDLSSGTNVLYLPETEVNINASSITAATIFGSVGTLYAFYEEIMHKISEEMGSDNPIINAEQAIGRRGFLKLIATLFAAHMVRQRQLDFVRQNTNAASDIRNDSAQVLKKLDMTPTVAFQRIMGISPSDLIGSVQQMIEYSGNAIELYTGKQKVLFFSSDDKHWPGIKNTLQEIINTSTEFSTILTQDIPSGQVPPEMVKLFSYIQVTRQIKALASGKKFEVEYTRHLQDAAFAALQLLGSGIGIETIIKVTDLFADMIKNFKTKNNYTTV